MRVKLILNLLLNLFFSFIGRNKLSILTYHRVGNSDGSMAMNEALFEQQLIWLRRYFNPVHLAEGLELQKEGRLPRRSVAITVDDGYSDSFYTIFPLLQKHQLTATFFISTAGIKDGFLWDELVSYNIMNTSISHFTFQGESYSLLTKKERTTSLAACLNKLKYHSLADRTLLITQLLEEIGSIAITGHFLQKEEILSLQQAGMGVGAHTHNHPILLKESDDTVRYEIQQSRDQLEKIINQPVKLFAYPNGKYQLDFSDKHIKIVKEIGFDAAFSTDIGTLSCTDKDFFQIKRFTPWDKTEFNFTLRLALNFWK